MPRSSDIRKIYFRIQRGKNIIPNHAALTPKFNLEITRAMNRLNSETDVAASSQLEAQIYDLLERKRGYEDQHFEKMRDELENTILNPPHHVRLRYRRENGRLITTFSKPSSALLLLDRYVSLTLKRCFRVETKGRDQCIRVLLNALNISKSSKRPAHRSIIRTDITDFYDSISHRLLLEKLEDHSGVPRFAKQHIRRVLEGYAKAHGRDRGIPQGIPSSAVLAEIYLEIFDQKLQGAPGVVAYLRYVDDILVVAESSRGKHTHQLLNDHLRKLELTENAGKLLKLTHPSPSATEMDFLGYSFKFEAKTSQLCAVDISQGKLQRYLAAISNIDNHASRIACWADEKAVILLLSSFEYLLFPHATRPALEGMRIVTGLAYSARFAFGPLSEQQNLRAVIAGSQRCLGILLSRLKGGSKVVTIPTCPHCKAPVSRWTELSGLERDVRFEKMMKFPAKEHREDAVREKVQRILWNVEFGAFWRCSVIVSCR